MLCFASSLYAFMLSFSQRAEAKLADVGAHLQELDALSNSVAEYFCEDPATFKLEECCSIFHSFCKRFDTAVRVSVERMLLLVFKLKSALCTYRHSAQSHFADHQIPTLIPYMGYSVMS